MSEALENILVTHTSPAICGIKASNLINIDYNESIYEEIKELNEKYKNICFYILKEDSNKVLVLVYRKNILERSMNNSLNIEFLKSLGYNTSSLDSMLIDLKNRIEFNSFPHEIGVFLGYDLEDIKSFMCGNKCLYVGYWKVYSNVEKKQEIFNHFTRCRECVSKLVNRGFSFENFMR